MALSGVVPWLVGLPASDTVWNAPGNDTDPLPAISPRSEPSTNRSRLRDDTEGTVNRRAQSSSPAKQQSLAWKRRLVDGQLGYGDQTDLFGPSGLENIFTRTQAADSNSQKRQRQLGHRLKSKLKDKTTTIDAPKPDASARASVHASYANRKEQLPARPISHNKTSPVEKKSGYITGMVSIEVPIRQSSKKATMLSPRLEAATQAGAEEYTTAERSTTESDLEDLTPVFISKRTSSSGKIHYNAIRADNAARCEIYKSRKDIDKTETSQRAREAELAMGAEQSETTDCEESTEDRTKVLNRIMGITDSSIVEADDDMGTRHISGFTDAPEVEEDMPVEGHHAASWDFSELPLNESSELAAAHKSTENKDKRAVSFGLKELNDYAFKMVDKALEDATEATVDETHDIQSPENIDLAHQAPQSRDSSPDPDVQAPGSRMPFEFRKDSLAEIHNTSAKSKRTLSKSSLPSSVMSPALTMPKTRSSPAQSSPAYDSVKINLPQARSPPQFFIEDTDDVEGFGSAAEGKRPLPRSPLKSPTPKRRRTLHDSELQSVTDANVSYHSQLQNALNDASNERQNTADASVIAQRKMARGRSATPSQGPATKDYINEAKKVIELLRGNATSSPLGGITEAEEEDTQAESELVERDPKFNTHRSDNLRTLAPQQVAHLIGGEMHGMTFDRTNNCWIRSKSFEHKQFLDPRDALSSDDDPFREISDLTVEKSARVHAVHSTHEAEATTVVHHELDDTGLSFGDDRFQREDTPQQHDESVQQTPKLPGDETTLAHYDEAHDSDPSGMTPTPTTDLSTSVRMSSQIEFPSPPNREMPIEVAKLRLSTTDPNANINNTFILSDLPEFTVNEEDHERPSERALASRMASYASFEISDQYTLATTELVKAVTDVQGKDIHWEDMTALSLHDKSLKSLHGLQYHCGRVEKLDVSSNALTQLDGVPSFVRQLNAQSNQLVSLTSWGHLMHLQYLDISNNNLESLDGLKYLIHLRELRVDNNKLLKLDGIADLDGLITLSARNNAVREVNFKRFRFQRVIELDISGNKIASIEGLETLASLRTLKLDSNPLGQTVSISSTTPRLKHLSLKSCGLELLDVAHFPNLRTLEVDNNKLSTITGIAELKKLMLLSMCEQNLDDEGCITIFDNPIEAQTIRLSRNNIPELRLDPEFRLDHAFMSVKHLELADIGLACLPANFGIQFPNLRTLNISYNGLKDIRPLAPLSGLEGLSVTGCRIERLRKTVATLGKLQKLQVVDLKDNPLTQGFYAPKGTSDRVYRAKLDHDTAIRRRTYELLLAYTCTQEKLDLDGMAFDAKSAMIKDGVWDRLMELGVLRKAMA